MKVALFGKLPTHGDFVSRGMGEAEQALWDGWLSEGLVLARDTLGDGFKAAHDAAPPWLFILPSGESADALQAGCVAASVDRAGRRFWILARCEAVGAAEGEAVAQACEQAIFAALADGMDADGLRVELERLTQRAAGSPGAPRPSGWWTEGGPDHAPAKAAPVCAPALALRMLTPAEPVTERAEAAA